MLDAGRMVIANEGVRYDWVVAFGNRRTGSSHHGVSDVSLACSTTRAPRIASTVSPISLLDQEFLSVQRSRLDLGLLAAHAIRNCLDVGFRTRSVSQHA